MTDAQLAKARRLADEHGFASVEFREGYIEHPPVDDGSVDCVISNGVINLSPDKPAVFAAAAARCGPAAGSPSPTSSPRSSYPRASPATPRSGRRASAARCNATTTARRSRTPASRSRPGARTPHTASCPPRRQRHPQVRRHEHLTARPAPLTDKETMLPSAITSPPRGPDHEALLDPARGCAVTHGATSIGSERIYLDHNATTPITTEVLNAMRPYLEHAFGNPSSAHRDGAVAHAAVDTRRAEVAALLGGEPGGVVLRRAGARPTTWRSRVRARTPGRARPHRDLGRRASGGARRLPLPAAPLRLPADDRARRRVRRRRSERRAPGDPARHGVVSVMHANNEIGTVQPIAEIAAVAHERGVLVHTDAAQSVGKLPLDVEALGVDLLDGRRPQALRPERHRRALRAPGHAARSPHPRRRARARPARRHRERSLHRGSRRRRHAGRRPAATGQQLQMQRLRDRLHAVLRSAVPGLELNGQPRERLPNTLNVSFPGIDGARLLVRAPPRSPHPPAPPATRGAPSRLPS